METSCLFPLSIWKYQFILASNDDGKIARLKRDQRKNSAPAVLPDSVKISSRNFTERPHSARFKMTGLILAELNGPSNSASC